MTPVNTRKIDGTITQQSLTLNTVSKIPAESKRSPIPQTRNPAEIEENITVTPATAIATPQTAMQNEKITKAFIEDLLEEKIEIAKKLKAKGMNKEEISEITKLTITEIEEI